jgi:hypothetical protein
MLRFGPKLPEFRIAVDALSDRCRQMFTEKALSGEARGIHFLGAKHPGKRRQMQPIVRSITIKC